MKKIIALFLSVFMLQASTAEVLAYTLSREDGTIIGGEETEPVEEVKPEDMTEYEKWDVLEMFYTLGVTDEDTTAYSTLDEPMTKGLFIHLLGNMYFYNSAKISPTVSVYDDTGINHYASGYIEQFEALGIIHGNGNGQFDGTKNISLDEAYKLVVSALGYGDLAASIGVYPTAYHRVAADLDIDIAVKNTSEITRREVFELFYKMLYTKVYEIDSFGDNRITYTAENTFMYVNMGIYSGEGVVLTSGLKSISGGATGENSVIIGERQLRDSDKMSEKYLGYNTEYFYNEDDALIYIMPKKTNVLEIGNTEMTYSNFVLSYSDGVKMKRATIEKDVSIVYNGRAAQGISCLPPQYGDVLLIDNDNNRAYDVIIVNDYVTYYLDGVNADRTLLNVENSQGIGVIKLDDYNDVQVYDASGERLSTASLEKGMVIMVQESGDYIKITACTESLSGKVNTIDTSDNSFVIDETELKASPYMYIDAWSGDRLGVPITALLDKFGNAAAAIGIETENSWKVMMMTRAVYYDDEPEYSFLEYVNELGDIKKIRFNEKVRLDGRRVEQHECIAALGTYTIVRFLTDENELVSAVDTPKTKTYLDSIGDDDGADEYDCLYKRVSGTLVVVNTESTLIPETSKNTTGNGYVFRKPETMIYKIPARGRVASMTSNDIYIAKWSDYTNDTIQDVDAYFIGNELMASVIVNFTSDVGSNTATISGDSSPMLVKSVVLGIDEDDLPVYTVTGVHNGATMSYVVSDRFKYGTAKECVRDFSTVKPGDIIRFNLDGNKKIEVCEKVYSADGCGLLNNVAYNNANPMGVNRLVNSRILMYTDEVIMFRAIDASIPENMLKLGSTVKMYVYDRGESKENAIKTASAFDLKLAATNPSTYEAIIIGTYHSQGRNIFLIK